MNLTRKELNDHNDLFGFSDNVKERYVCSDLEISIYVIEDDELRAREGEFHRLINEHAEIDDIVHHLLVEDDANWKTRSIILVSEERVPNSLTAYFKAIGNFINDKNRLHTLKKIDLIHRNPKIISQLQELFNSSCRTDVVHSSGTIEHKESSQCSTDQVTKEEEEKSSSSPESSASTQPLQPLVLRIHDLKVVVCQEDITKIEVDAIVNAANERLMHYAGVAGAIAKAAGPNFQAIGEEHVKKHGSIKTGEVWAQRAENLTKNSVTWVINAVGPTIYDSTSMSSIRKTLCQAVLNAFQEAEKLSCRSLAIPAISSGIFGVPMYECTKAYWTALRIFARSKKHHLKEINFANIDSETTTFLHELFKNFMTNEKKEIECEEAKSLQEDTEEICQR